jgi:tRNA1(Val) A37 N6-methylase TrmN6
MSSRSTREKQIAAARREHRADNEPLISKERSVIKQGGALYINVISNGQEILGITEGDSLEVDVYEDHMAIRTED